MAKKLLILRAHPPPFARAFCTTSIIIQYTRHVTYLHPLITLEEFVKPFNFEKPYKHVVEIMNNYMILYDMNTFNLVEFTGGKSFHEGIR